MTEKQLPGRIAAATAFAAAAHTGHARKATRVPYLIHPLRVMDRLTECDRSDDPVPEDVLIAALLHDTVEDTSPQQGTGLGPSGVEAHALTSPGRIPGT